MKLVNLKYLEISIAMGDNSWKREFKAQYVRVEHQKPYLFVTCAWQKRKEVHWAYVFFRVFMSALFISIIICSVLELDRSNKPHFHERWLIYFTYWGFLLCTVQFIIGAGIAIRQMVVEKKHGKHITIEKKLNFWYKAYWVSNTTAFVAAIGISIIYWFFLYDPKKHHLEPINISVHGGNTFFMSIDFIVAAHPFRFLHFYWVFLFVATYLLFNLLYFELGGTGRETEYIYSLTNWNLPRKVLIIVILGLVLTIVLHIVVWLCYMLKRWLVGLCLKENSPFYEDYRISSPEGTHKDVKV